MAVVNNDLQFFINPAEEVTLDKQEDMKREKTREQCLSLKKEVHLKTERKQDIVAFEKERANIEMSIAMSTSQIKMKKLLIKTEASNLYLLNKTLEFNRKYYDDFLNSDRIRAEDALKGIEEARRRELELDALIDELIGEKKSFERELDQIDGDLSHFTHCRDILLKMSPVERQEAQKAKALNVQFDTGSDAQECSPCSVTASENGSNKKHFTQSRVDADKNYPALYFSAPLEALEAMADLTEQDLSLIQNSPKVEDTLKELSQSIENTTAKMKEVEDKVTLQILDLKDRVDREKTSVTKLKQTVILYDSLKTADEDIMLNTLGEKVSKTYSQCVDKRSQYLLSTLEMLAKIESRMCTLLDQLESIPEDFVEGVMRIKESEKRSRQQEEQLRLKREKQKERLKKCMQRSLGDSKKKMGRKLMPRSIPVESHAKEEEEENQVSEEDELEAFLFCTEDNE